MFYSGVMAVKYTYKIYKIYNEAEINFWEKLH